MEMVSEDNRYIFVRCRIEWGAEAVNQAWSLELVITMAVVAAKES